jgi:hypothetical protein
MPKNPDVRRFNNGKKRGAFAPLFFNAAWITTLLILPDLNHSADRWRAAESLSECE